ncbi:MAG: fatty acid CoA ligase family protein [Nannocystaceae bacterium]
MSPDGIVAVSKEEDSAAVESRTHINVAAYLPQIARRQPDLLAVAVACPGKIGRYVTLTTAELNRRSDRIAHGLVAMGIGEGVRTVLMVKPSPEFFAITFAMLKIGAVPVMVDPGMGVRNLGQCLAEARPQAFIGIPKAHLARVVLGWARQTLKTKLTVGRRILWGGDSLAQLEASAPQGAFPVLEPDPEQTAAILFTSGSTGVPKGVVTPHRVFAAQVHLLRTVFGIESGERDLSTFPLFALFGPALGMASIVPDMDASRPASADPAKLVQALHDFQCTNMFASPALIDKLGRHCEVHQIRLNTLRRAISAGAPASIPALERFVKFVPEGVEVFTPYGATEALPVAVLGSHTILSETRHHTERGGGVCVGKPVASMHVRILPISEEPVQSWAEEAVLPTGDIGEICVRGPVVTPSYYNREDATRRAKIIDPAGGIWHRMGDLGYFDGRGRLWMCGRMAHRLETADGRMYTISCEAVFNTHRAVFRTALVGVRKRKTIMPVICVEREQGVVMTDALLVDELRGLARAHGHTRRIDTFLVHRALPVDVRHNAKIFREKLAVWASRRLR